jgi:tRNA (cytidine/uridine-2'-O-)-methyltransferase
VINVVLFEPEIPPNTGNIIRLAANTGAKLHLIEPLGFDLDDKKLRRAGLDYHEFSDLTLHRNWQEFRIFAGDNRVLGVSTKGTITYCDMKFRESDFIVFGPETRGLPAQIRDELGAKSLLRVPMLPDSRSLNLSNTAAILIYEAWAQQNFVGGQCHPGTD